VRNSKNTVAFFRDYLGKEYDSANDVNATLTLNSFKSIDPTPCHASAHPQQSSSTIAFSIHDTQDEKPNTISVSEVTTRHIRRLKQSASDFSGKTVTSAVIAIPTDASDAQKEALEKAAESAGVNVLQLIAEPIAALMAYDTRGDHRDRVVVVADYGGSRSDVAVIASRGGMYSILATAHDYELGGVRLDQVLVDHFAKEFVKKHKTDPRENERSLAKLKLEAESVKKSLSLSASATFSVESLADGLDFRSTVNKTRYELLAGKVFQSFTRLIEEAVKKADLDLLDIDEVCPSRLLEYQILT
jgi:molecular chaperone DnaK (HSP70)